MSVLISITWALRSIFNLEVVCQMHFEVFGSNIVQKINSIDLRPINVIFKWSIWQWKFPCYMNQLMRYAKEFENSALTMPSAQLYNWRKASVSSMNHPLSVETDSPNCKDILIGVKLSKIKLIESRENRFFVDSF